MPNTLYTKGRKYRQKKETRIIKRRKKELVVAIMSFNQSRDIIRSRCSAYILFIQSTRRITYNQNFGMITNNIIYNLDFLYSYNYIQ